MVLTQVLFGVMKQKLGSKPEFQYGMLIFDKMQVQEQKCVNAKTLTYVRLAKHAHGEMNAGSIAGSTKLANPVLVFRYTPFGENYTQSVGVSASRTPTKGTMLSQLVLQAIIYC